MQLDLGESGKSGFFLKYPSGKGRGARGAPRALDALLEHRLLPLADDSVVESALESSEERILPS